MPDFKENLIDSIGFCKKNFDFLEFTIFPGNSYQVDLLKKELEGFPVFGHLHWENDIVDSYLKKDFSRVFKEIDFFKALGAEYITVHPSNSNEIELNRRSLSVINKRFDSLLVENSAKDPFSHIDSLMKLGFGITMDIGHLIISSGDINHFLQVGRDDIKHFHIHGISNGKDHCDFDDENKLLEIIEKVSKYKKDFSFSLEIFLKNRENEFSSIEERRELLLSYSRKIKKARIFDSRPIL